jgi:tetratricopeptide (TPR) repeat protein
MSLLRTSARGVASFGGRPDDQLTDSIRGTFEKAKELGENALALSKALGRKDGMAAAYSRLGGLYSASNESDQAQAMIEEALALNKALQRKKAMADNYRELAEMLRYDLDQADALLKEALALHEALGLKEEMARDYAKLAAINTTRGEPYEAERFYKQALEFTPRLEQGRLLSALERLYQDRNDPGQAAEMREQADAIAKEREKETGGRMILFYSRLGLFVSLSAAKSQVEALEKVVPMEKKLGQWVGLATSYTLLGLHYGQRADINEDKDIRGRAESMFREALVLNETLKREDAMAYVYRELAEIVDKRGKLEEVEATLESAQALHKKLGQEKEMARLYWSLGFDRNKRGDNTQACTYWRAGALAYPTDKQLVDALNQYKCAATQ